MEPEIFSDKNVKPTDDLVFSVIGDKELLWKQLFSHLHDHYKEVIPEWNYYKDGKSWLLKTQRKKKTIFWIKVEHNTFRVAFWFGDKAEELILNSTLPERIKTEFKEGKRYGKIRGIPVEMEDATDLENVKKLIEVKLAMK